MRAALVILALGLTVWAYAPSRTQPVIYEEYRAIPWQHLTTADLAQSVIATLKVRPRALTTLTFRLNAYGAYDHGTPFRLFNVLLHCLNGLLVMAIGVTLIGPLGGVVAGSAMLLHPINSQAVTYLAARADLVSTTGVLIALWAAVARRWWLVTLGLLAALTGKESAIVGLPLVVWTLWRTHRLTLSRWLLVAAVPVLAIGGYIAWLVVQFGEVNDPLIVSRGPVAFAGVQLFAVTRWLWLIVSLHGFSIDPDFEGWLGRWIVLAAIGWLVALGVGIYLRDSRPWLLTALGWVLIALAPRFLLPTSEFVTEHQSYLALVGIWFLVGATYESVVCGASGMVADCARDRGVLDRLGVGRRRVAVG